jgi:hypothetical protein
MNALQELQVWYLSQCNEVWEHTYGISIGTLDNPGWSVTIDLKNTNVMNKAFSVHVYGVHEHSAEPDNNWIHCKVEDNKFIGNGGPMKLEEILNVFLSWARS